MGLCILLQRQSACYCKLQGANFPRVAVGENACYWKALKKENTEDKLKHQTVTRGSEKQKLGKRKTLN